MEMKPLIFYKTTANFNNTGEVLIYKSLLEKLRIYGRVIIDDSPREYTVKVMCMPIMQI